MVTLFAQKPTVDAYRIKVVTKDGYRFRGTFSDIDNSFIYLSFGRYSQEDRIPLTSIRKVVIRRNNKKSVLISGAIVGGLLSGYLANESIKTSPTRSPVAHGVTVAFAAVGGAASGLLLGSVIGSISSRVIRPLNLVNPDVSLFRQLEPFSLRYQQDIINRLPKNSQ